MQGEECTDFSFISSSLSALDSLLIQSEPAQNAHVRKYFKLECDDLILDNPGLPSLTFKDMYLTQRPIYNTSSTLAQELNMPESNSPESRLLERSLPSMATYPSALLC